MANPTSGQFTTGWSGVETFMHPDRFHIEHKKYHGRPRIGTTHLGDFVNARDEDETDSDAYLTTADRLREVYYSKLQFNGEEHEWHFGRALGAGSFGMVASWFKRLGNGTVDHLVTKSEAPCDWTAAHPDRQDVSAETFLMAQLHERQCVDEWARMGIVQLRGYRYIHGVTSTITGFAFQPTLRHQEIPLYREWRTYMENCFYGNISRVMLTYKAWGYHVPEAFVWWTFYWLVEGCRAMDKDTGEPFKRMVSGNRIQSLVDSWMLANDIKAENCFYGQARTGIGAGLPYDIYPAARVGDFGLSQVVQLDANNRGDKLHRGTPVWTAPEKRKIHDMGQDAQKNNTYLFFDPRRVDGPSWAAVNGIPETTNSHCIGPEANLWTIGLIIFVLMTGEDIRTITHRINWKLSLANRTRDSHAAPKYLYLPSEFPGSLSGNEDYSPELKMLVAECCRLEPLNRPVLDSVRSSIANGINRERLRLQAAFGSDAAIVDATRMAFTNQDWHDMPQGPFLMARRPIPGRDQSGDAQFWFEFTENIEKWQDPDAPPLFVPGRTSESLPRGVRDQVRPFAGTDYVTYVSPGATNSYWRGRPLPRGGRAQPPQI